MMRRFSGWSAVLVIATALALQACGQATASPAPPTEPPPEPPTEAPIVLSGSVPEGGRLYDKWWSELDLEAPTEDQPLWASQTTNERSGDDTWRCKECHGWDYAGADGAYGSGSHYTGFAGILDSSSLSDGELLAWLDGSANREHDFSPMGDAALGSLVKFIQDGVMDISGNIDGESKEAVGGDPSNGQALYETTCTACHGADGRMINFGDEEDPEYVGTIALGNPWEFIHKVRAGQPGTQMPSAIEGGWSYQDVVDVLAYSQSLPVDPPPPGSVTRGGRLYDKWWSELELEAPAEDHPLWASQTTNERSGSDTWRCKECHGWDYLGAEGAYGSGSHFTGFPGVYGAQEFDVEALVSVLSGEVDASHDFSVMGEEAVVDVASFLSESLIDLRMYVDPETKTVAEANTSNGESLYAETCAVCHGGDGRLINFGDEDDPEFVSAIALDNPWEFVHKVRFGQPASNMPSALDLGWSLQDVLDVLAFSQTLPTEAP